MGWELSGHLVPTLAEPLYQPIRLRCAGISAAIQATGRGPGVFSLPANRSMSAMYMYALHVARYSMHVKIHVPDWWCGRSPCQTRHTLGVFVRLMTPLI
jgi:hypothetical protein